MDEKFNDNDAGRPAIAPPQPDAYGQAAMLLVESLIHGLIERSVISVAEAVAIVDIAAEVKAEIAADLGNAPVTLHRSLAILDAISASLKLDKK